MAWKELKKKGGVEAWLKVEQQKKDLGKVMKQGC